MPPLIPCADTRCDGLADKLGDYCYKCKQKMLTQKQNRWKSSGWTRYENRTDAQKHGGQK